MLFPELANWLERDCLIERPTVADDFGQSTAWTELATVKCNVRALTGDEAINLDAIDSRSTHRVVVDYTDVTHGDRLTIDGKQYNVRFVDRKLLDAIGGDFLQIDAELIGVVQ